MKPYKIAAKIQHTAPTKVSFSVFNIFPLPVTIITPIKDSIIAIIFLNVIRSFKTIQANITVIIGHK